MQKNAPRPPAGAFSFWAQFSRKGPKPRCHAEGCRYGQTFSFSSSYSGPQVIKNAKQRKDAGLPDKNRRDPHSPGGSPALQRRIKKQKRCRASRQKPPGAPQPGGKPGATSANQEAEKMPGFPTKTAGTPTARGKARRYIQTRKKEIHRAKSARCRGVPRANTALGMTDRGVFPMTCKKLNGAHIKSRQDAGATKWDARQ